MYQASFKKYILQFKYPSGTSRGILTEKVTWFIFLTSQQNSAITGVGECGPLKGLSIDDKADFENKLAEVCKNIHRYIDQSEILIDYPSIQFGLETALLDHQLGGRKVLFPSEFTQGNDSISINGLVWMGDKAFMQKQIREKIESGFHCIKLKIGAIDFETELEIISDIRQQFSPDDIEIRVDANGGFSPKDALDKLNQLSAFTIHSIEQPIRQKQYEAMADLCEKSPIPIVLDEELIGVKMADMENLLQTIKPAYIILKPSLIGGFGPSEEWIRQAKKLNIGWWITSALESNIGLNAIAQWTATLGSSLPQGLGTGQLYQNNIPSPLQIEHAKLFHRPENKWNLSSVLH